MDRHRTPVGVWIASGGVIALLLSVAGRYGFHRDELYFVIAGRNLDWGYVDQPPLVPLVARLAEMVGGLENPFWLRVLPALAVGVVAWLAASMAHRFGGGSMAETLAAFGVGWVGVLLGEGHLLSTAVFDFLFWTVALWMLVALLNGADRRQWIALGLVIGIGLQAKHTAVLLAVSVAVALLVTDRRVLASIYPWIGAAVAAVVAAPSVIWQAANGWPQLEMIESLGERSEGPLAFVLLQPALLSVAMVIPAGAGLWWLLRSGAARKWRSLAIAYLILLAFFTIAGAKAYYIAPMYSVLIAAGAVVIERWTPGRRRWMIGAGSTGLIAGLFIALPLLPVESMQAFDATGELSETVGWPELVDQIGREYSSLPSESRDTAVILTGTYGEAGAVAVLGDDLPPVYSGHNSFWSWGPPADHGPVIGVGYVEAPMATMCPGIVPTASITNPYGVENEEAGLPIYVCLEPLFTLEEIWESVRHYN